MLHVTNVNGYVTKVDVFVTNVKNLVTNVKPKKWQSLYVTNVKNLVTKVQIFSILCYESSKFRLQMANHGPRLEYGR